MAHWAIPMINFHSIITYYIKYILYIYIHIPCHVDVVEEIASFQGAWSINDVGHIILEL